jgi:hypothetical protein
MAEETYLGDGLYARIDAGAIWLRAPREDGDHMVALEPEVFAALCKLAQKSGLVPQTQPQSEKT